MKGFVQVNFLATQKTILLQFLLNNLAFIALHTTKSVICKAVITKWPSRGVREKDSTVLLFVLQ